MFYLIKETDDSFVFKVKNKNKENKALFMSRSRC